MRHLIVSERGTFVGLKSERVVVKLDGDLVCEVPLRNLRTIKVAKTGIAISSDLVLACSVRGIHLFFTNFKGEAAGFLCGTSQHAVANVRRKQFAAVEGAAAGYLSKIVIFGKIRNQRAVLLYFGKYLKKTNSPALAFLESKVDELDGLAAASLQLNADDENWRQNLMGIEGRSAAVYFSAWPLLGVPFVGRKGRGASDPVNFALNYGYAILQSHIWTAVTNAGLEPYVGFLHADRAGKPSLVLDLMEEYRPWVVDRVVIKMMSKQPVEFEPADRRRLVAEIEKSLESRVVFGGKRLRMETIIQRRIYRLAGVFAKDEQKYSPFLFRLFV